MCVSHKFECVDIVMNIYIPSQVAKCRHMDRLGKLIGTFLKLSAVNTPGTVRMKCVSH